MQYPLPTVALLSLLASACSTSAGGSAGRDEPQIPRPPIDTTQLPPKELAKQLVPRHRTGSSLLARLTDTTFLERHPEVPLGRLAAGPMLYELDVRFQDTIGQLIEDGILGPRTLVLDDTGHSIPNLARAMQEPSLSMVGTVHFPWNEIQRRRRPAGMNDADLQVLIDTSQRAVADHAQTFGDVIDERQRDMAGRVATGLYVALDGERYLDLRTRDWPSADELQLFGITHVLVLLERARAWRFGLADVAADLRPYVQTLSRAGLPVRVEGVDVRVGAMVSAGRPLDSRPGGNLAGFR
jgi:hypothetical protein